MSGLEARGVTISRGGRRLVEGVDLRIGPGEFHALLGPNGSGKSTMLRALAGLWAAEAGEVSIAGQAVSKMSRRDIARAVSYVPQDTRMDFAFTVNEIISMGRFAHRGRFEAASAADRDAVDRAMSRADVGHLRERAVNTLSGGERQRTVIARSLAAEPRYLLLDEPTANLDIRHAVEVFELCRQLAAQGQSIVLATHDLAGAARYATQVTVLDGGRVAGCGPIHQAMDEPLIRKVFGVGTERLVNQAGEPVYLFSK